MSFVFLDFCCWFSLGVKLIVDLSGVLGWLGLVFAGVLFGAYFCCAC